MNVEARQLALVMYLTWHPNQAWWHEIALSTWTEPSPALSSFISSTIYSVSKFEDPHVMKQ